MLANLRVFRTGMPVVAAGDLSRAASTQWRLAVLLVANMVMVAAAFSVENALMPWRIRMDATTPGWCFVLAEASAVGVVSALVIEGGWLAVAESLLFATLLGYAYFLAGAALIDPRRGLQLAHLVFRGVELGMVCVAGMMLGVVVRLIFRRRLSFVCRPDHRTVAQYQLGELMFLVVVFALGLGLINLFFDHFDRETQLAEILLAIVRAFPAALPWLWGVARPKLTLLDLAVIVGGTVFLMILKAVISYSISGDAFADVLLLAGQRAAAYATSATINGMLLRSLGFRWRAV
ncbi:MAG: hypothetical protein JF612_01210 [Planctomycetia bacterium]|jgi:hypothetical protein|nr:hypothetical protein [Planctomycetia bacterium]